MAGSACIRVVWEGGDEVDFDACDVRPSGAFLKSELMYEHGSALAVQLTLPGLGDKVLRAEVVSVDLAGRMHGRPGMGIAFRGLAPAERHALRRM